MSPYVEPNDVVSLTLDGGSLVLPLELAGPLVPGRRPAVTTAPFAAGRRLVVAFRSAGSWMARFLAAGQLGAGTAAEQGRWTGARC